MASRKHTHKYHRVDTDSGALWSCALPECNHFMPAHYTKLLPGKFSVCWNCGNTLILTAENMKMAQPVCADCAGITALLEFADNLQK